MSRFPRRVRPVRRNILSSTDRHMADRARIAADVAGARRLYFYQRAMSVRTL